MKNKIAILFYAKSAKASKNGLLPIYLRITVDGVRIEISTSRFVEKSKWSVEGLMPTCNKKSRPSPLSIITFPISRETLRLSLLWWTFTWTVFSNLIGKSVSICIVFVSANHFALTHLINDEDWKQVKKNLPHNTTDAAIMAFAKQVKIHSYTARGRGYLSLITIKSPS